jgi:hypothetical protein
MLTSMSGESSGLAGPWPVRATASVSHRLWAIRAAQGWRLSWSPDACPFQSHSPSCLPACAISSLAVPLVYTYCMPLRCVTQPLVVSIASKHYPLSVWPCEEAKR